MSAALDATLDPAGALALRRAIYSKPFVSRTDFAHLLDCGRRCGASACEEYGELLADVATDLLVNQVDPPKYVAQDDADWVVAQIKSGDGLSCRAEYQALLAVIRYAVSLPSSFADFAVAEIEKAIVEGRYVGGACDHTKAVVEKSDVEALRLTAFAPVEGNSLHVSRSTAEALFRIAHATATAKNDPSFDDFFAKAIGDHLTGIAFHWTPSVAEERAKERWLDEKTPSFASALGGLFHLGQTNEQRDSAVESVRIGVENAADRAEIARRNNVSVEDGDWILAHLTRDGALTSAELKLLIFLKSDAGSLPPALAKVIEAQAA
jgi:hypothetical protein